MAETNQAAAPFSTAARWFWPALIALVVVVAGVTQGVLGLQLLGYDDGTYVLQNPLIHPLNPETIGRMFARTYFRSYTPLTHLSHAVDFSLWGANPFGHHLTNYLLHLANTALVFLLAAALIPGLRPPAGERNPLRYLAGHSTPGAVLGALFASAFFALHPLRVESVAWVSDRKDLLMTFFSLLSFLSYLAYRGGFERKERWYLVSFVAATFAMLAKTVAAMIPVVFILADRLLFDVPFRAGAWRKPLVEKIPFLTVAGLVGMAALSAVVKILPHPRVIETSFLEDALAPFYTWTLYLGKTFYPVGLTPMYGFPGEVMLLFGAVAAVLLTAAAILAARRGVQVPLFAWSCYTLFVLPTILGRRSAGIQSWAERYSYLPGVVIAVLLAWGAVWFAKKRGHAVRILLTGLLAAVVPALSLSTLRLIPIWHDDVSLFTYAVAQSPRSIMALANLGSALTTAGRVDEAIATLERASALNERYAGAYENLGLAWQGKGDQRRAAEYYRRAIALDTNFVEAYSNLGNAYYALGEYDRAIEQYRQSIRKDPEFSDPYYNLGVATYAKGDTMAAMAIFRKAAEVNPNSADTYASMGIIYSDLGMSDSAYVQFKKAAELGHPRARELVKSWRH